MSKSDAEISAETMVANVNASISAQPYEPVRTISYDKLSELMNTAADQILEAAEAPDVGVPDAVNLLVNVVLTRIKHPDMTLAEVVEDAYDEATLADVLAWINGKDGPDEIRRTEAYLKRVNDRVTGS